MEYGPIARSPSIGLSAVRPRLTFALAAVVAVVGYLAVRSVGPHLHQAIRDLGGAQRNWIAVAGLCFLSAAVATAAAWRSALTASAGSMSFVDTMARYAVGSLVNTFVPMRAGDAVRIGLLSRAFERTGRIVTTTGLFAFLGIVRVAALTLLLLPAAAVGILPLKMLWLAGAVLAVAIAVVLCLPRRVDGLAGRFFEALRVVSRSPAATMRVLGWLLLSSASRVGAAAASASALGVSKPLVAAAIIVPALELSSLVPVTPGNFGVTSGVVALALHAQGVDTATALAVGIGFHAVETVVGVSFGSAGLLGLGATVLPRARRIAAFAVASAGFVALAAFVGVFLDVP